MSFDPVYTDKNNHRTDSEQGNENGFDDLHTTQHEKACIHKLSIEVIARIFARLDPTSLVTASRTCRYWRHIVMDDVCWKNAFLAYFGQLPYKRVRPTSWKEEYILRTHLIRKWEKGRGTLMTFNPKVGSIDDMFIDFENNFMMTAGKDQGFAVKCNPTTGKLERHLLYSTDEGIPTQVSAVTMDGNRVLWGFAEGFITMTTRAKTLVRRQLKVFSDFHQGAVRALYLPSFTSDVALSAGDDGIVKIWNVTTGLSVKDLHGSTSSPICLEASMDHHIMAGYSNGTVVVWDIQLCKLLRLDDSTANLQRRLIQPPLIDKDTPVQSIHYDLLTQSVIVVYDGLSKLYQYDIQTGRLTTVFGGNGPMQAHTLGTICAFTWDISPSSRFTDESLLDSRMALASNSNNHGKNKSNTAHRKQQLSPLNIPPLSSPTQYSYQRLIATGDTSGTIYLWRLENSNRSDSDNTVNVVHPLRQFDGHQAPISVIYLDSFKIVGGADDGWIRVWDPLTGELLHTLGNKIPRHAPVDRSDLSVMRVNNIVCDEYRGVATIGHQIKSWDFSSQALYGRRTLKSKSKTPSPAVRDELHYEIKQEVKASQMTLAQERKEHEMAMKQRNEWSLGGLSDDEVMAYAMMISQEQNTLPIEEQQSHSAEDSLMREHLASNYDEEEALVQAVMASLEMTQEEENSSPSSSPTVGSSSSPSSLSTAPGMGKTDVSTSLYDDTEWPTIESSTATSSNGNTTPHHNSAEEDEALQYALRLSRNEL